MVLLFFPSLMASVCTPLTSTDESPITLTNTLFDGCDAAVQLSHASKVASVINCTFVSCGAGIDFRGLQLSVGFCVFSSCSTSRVGSAIYSVSRGATKEQYELADSSVTNCRGDANTGFTCSSSVRFDLTIARCNFTSNVAASYGAALLIITPINFVLSFCSFLRNQRNLLCLRGKAEDSITQSVACLAFVDNSGYLSVQPEYPGMIYIQQTWRIEDSVFAGNAAGPYAGGPSDTVQVLALAGCIFDVTSVTGDSANIVTAACRMGTQVPATHPSCAPGGRPSATPEGGDQGEGGGGLSGAAIGGIAAGAVVLIAAGIVIALYVMRRPRATGDPLSKASLVDDHSERIRG